MTCFKPIWGGWFRMNMEYIDKAAAFATGMNFWFSVSCFQRWLETLLIRRTV